MTAENQRSHHARLRVRGPDGTEAEVLLAGTQLAVGREPDCNDLVLDDPEVIISREHCLLERRDRVWFVIDYGSRNGTFLLRAGEMEPIRRPTPLLTGDIIRIHARRGAVPQFWELVYEDPYRTRPLVEQPAGVRVAFDRSTQTLYVVSGAPPQRVEIRHQERLLLCYMVERNERNSGNPAPCSHADLIQAVWGDEDLHHAGDVTGIVASLRKKLRPFALSAERDFIETVRGYGYTLHAGSEVGGAGT
jgi:pSer/pThr/pTyr-binding forkhead associated (FHA) protein